MINESSIPSRYTVEIRPARFPPAVDSGYGWKPDEVPPFGKRGVRGDF
jgi:hypothetical protein